jgi:hypothetical protein
MTDKQLAVESCRAWHDSLSDPIKKACMQRSQGKGERGTWVLPKGNDLFLEKEATNTASREMERGKERERERLREQVGHQKWWPGFEKSHDFV